MVLMCICFLCLVFNTSLFKKTRFHFKTMSKSISPTINSGEEKLASSSIFWIVGSVAILRAGKITDQENYYKKTCCLFILICHIIDPTKPTARSKQHIGKLVTGPEAGSNGGSWRHHSSVEASLFWGGYMGAFQFEVRGGGGYMGVVFLESISEILNYSIILIHPVICLTTLHSFMRASPAYMYVCT